ncbi:hypothetical protein [Deinococcus sp.]|uniref:hypothetical protein n=1 Tax=Deinococcus sp. TaxID=47478 RepID=UPI003C7DBB17
MTLTDDQDGRDQAPDEAELGLVSNLSVGVPGTVPAAETVAEQGDAPADLAERQAPHVPAPSREGLSAEEVARLAGGDTSSTEASNDLNRAEGVTPDDED